MKYWLLAGICEDEGYRMAGCERQRVGDDTLGPRSGVNASPAPWLRRRHRSLEVRKTDQLVGSEGLRDLLAGSRRPQSAPIMSSRVLVNSAVTFD
jgi:hypothetical protein